MEKQTETKEKVSCKYKNTNSFVLSCEKPSDSTKEEVVAPQTTETKTTDATQPAVEQPVAEQPVVEQPVADQTALSQVDTEEIEVPIVGDIDDSYVEPLGETASAPNYDNVVNYQYGTTTNYAASLTNPEEGITASDIALISIIALSCLAVVATAMVLTGRAMTNRVAHHKNFVRK